MKLSIFTSMTDPEKRNDPYKEALECYSEIADEVIIVGDDWPYEFSFDKIGKVFQDGFEKSGGDWVIRMDLDYFFHESDIGKIKNLLKQNNDHPAVAFPQYQFFTPDRYHVKTKICIAMNKKKFPNIISNGGGDMCLPTLNGERLLPSSMPQTKIPVWQYDSIFRTKSIISEDRARFARAWNRYFDNWGDRGGGTPDEAFDAWFEMIKIKYKKHALKMEIENHPKFIKNRLANIGEDQFGFNAFGLKDEINRSFLDFLKAYKHKYF
jgi:hypothetical protein